MKPVPLPASASSDAEARSALSFGPVDLLRLAILGRAARGGVEPETLVAEVQSMAGAFWRPAGEVVLAGLQQLIAEGDIRIDQHDRPRHMVTVRLTARGALHFGALMTRDVRDTPEPLFHAVMMIEVALVDVLPIAQRWCQVTALQERLKRDLLALRGEGVTAGRAGNPARCRSYARQFDEDRLEGEIRWLGALAEMAGSFGALTQTADLSRPT